MRQEQGKRDGMNQGTHRQQSRRTRRGRPPVTSRSEIFAAARRLIDDEGWEKLTVRRLAQELDIGTTTLYHHIRDRNDLLVQLVNDATSRFPQPELPEDPRERIIVATISLREALGALPWAAEVLSVDGEGCIGRPDRQTLWFVDTIIGSAVDSGCTPDRAGELFRNLWLFTVGEVMVSAHGKAPRTELGSRDAPAVEAADPSLPDVDTFPQGVRALVHGTLDRTD